MLSYTVAVESQTGTNSTPNYQLQRWKVMDWVALFHQFFKGHSLTSLCLTSYLLIFNSMYNSAFEKKSTVNVTSEWLTRSPYIKCGAKKYVWVTLAVTQVRNDDGVQFHYCICQKMGMLIGLQDKYCDSWRSSGLFDILHWVYACSTTLTNKGVH